MNKVTNEFIYRYSTLEWHSQITRHIYNAPEGYSKIHHCNKTGILMKAHSAKYIISYKERAEYICEAVHNLLYNMSIVQHRRVHVFYRVKNFKIILYIYYNKTLCATKKKLFYILFSPQVAIKCNIINNAASSLFLYNIFDVQSYIQRDHQLMGVFYTQGVENARVWQSYIANMARV